ncbi:MAG: DNA segregation ATPase FtsK/SpoIIIE, S-DNA-T family [Stygiobacter sp.]|nr:MAG: DNA segregation ATPase FtsK/SpoIIIE, S-DNA-T family [Stygiobacter sp.]
MLDEGPSSRILLGILGLPAAVARAIAREIALLRAGDGAIESFVHPDLAGGDIGDAKVSDRTATWHRNNKPDGVMLTLFSIPAAKVSSEEQSLAHVDRIDDEWLMSSVDIWAALALHDFDPDHVTRFANILHGLTASDAVSDAETMAGYALRVARHMRGDGLALGRAARRSLPALRIPRDAGDPRAQIENSPVLAERFFRKVAEEAKPYLNLRDTDGDPLNQADLKRKLKALEEAGDIEPGSATLLRALIDDPLVGEGEWTVSQAEAAEVSWDEAERLFVSNKAKDKKTFGEETLSLFRTHYREEDLSVDEVEFLSDLKRDSVRPGEAHDEFFHRHREKLRAEPKLFKRWERLVFRKPIETDDLAEGLLRLALNARREADDTQGCRLYIRLRGSENGSFWKDMNTRLCRLLRDRWRGMDRLLAPEVVLDLGRCWSHAWEGELKDAVGKPKENERASKDATNFEFEAFIVPEAEFKDGGKPSDAALKRAPRAQMTWRPAPNSMGTALPLDFGMVMQEGADVPLLTSVVAANRYDRHGSAQTVNLAESATVLDVFGQSTGRIARTDRDDFLVHDACARAIAEMEADGILTAVQADTVRAAIAGFRLEYGAAVAALAGHGSEGLASPSLVRQGELYGAALRVVMSEARPQIAVSRVWAPLLRIGMAEIKGERDGMLVTPLHPLRLAEVGVKARQLAEAVRKVTFSGENEADEIGNYVDMVCHALGKTYYADVGISDKRRLLIETRRLADVSLLESPTFGGDADELADEPAEGTVEKFELVTDEYLRLRPHEKSNFSAILVDAESEDLPLQMANGMARRIEAESDLRCDLVLTHGNPARLRQIYENQNRRIGHEIDSALTSEAARNFLSRLRVGIVGADGLQGAAAKWHDVAVLQDVIARRAKVRWVRTAPAGAAPDLATHVPTAVSRRKAFRKGDTTSGVFLTAPVLPQSAQAYLDALHDAIEGAPSEPGEPWLPLQEVEFDSGDVKATLDRAHRLANWVMTFDRLADRRLISSQGRRIIRYFSDPRSEHNVIVSAEISEADIGERLRSDLEGLLPSEPPTSVDGLVRLIHRNSADLSGAIVMRGAHSATHAQELLGLVITQREADLLLASSSVDHKTAWFFLDDFHGWLDLSKTRADILAVDLADTKEGRKVRLVVCEAKFVGQGNLGEQRKRSLGQLEDTYEILRKRIVSPDGTLDRSTWLGRLADLVLEHIAPFEQVGGVSFTQWIADIRAGAVPFEISGHSVVMVHDLNSDPETQPMVPDEDLPKGSRRPLAQWTFGRPSIAASLKGMLSDGAQGLLFVPDGWASPSSSLSDLTVAPVVLGGAPPPLPVVESAGRSAPESTSFSVCEARQHPAENAGNPCDVPEGWRPDVYEAVKRLSRPADHAKGQEWLDDQILRLKRALQKEGMDAPVAGARLTPNTGLVQVGGMSVTIGWLEKKQTDLLTRYGIDIVRITPQPGRIALGIRRPVRSILHLADAWLRRGLEGSAPERNMALLVGEREDDGELFYLSLASDFLGSEKAAPHTLVSGTTGSGKGILTTNLILDVCAFNDPKCVDVHLIDPKRGADYVWARRMPHLKSGIVEEKDDAAALLRSLVDEMEDRYRLITAAGCANIDQFNRKQSPSTRLPRVVIFFDEVANWMQDDEFKDEVDGLINEIATKSRAAGLHLFMIYQRADNQVMTMQLRANLGNKLILRLGDEGSSKIALGEKGAEKLLGKGHVIAKMGTDDKTYGQVPFIGEEEIMELADAIARAWS